MREIKFRAWDKKNNFMITQDDKQLKSLDLASGYIYVGHYKGENDRFIRFAEIKLMQYTGLKDANGVEIFEGDILRVWVTKTINFVATVDYLNGAFVIGSIPTGYGYHYRFSSFHNNVGTRYEVIGNIYENKNLLEEK